LGSTIPRQSGPYRTKRRRTLLGWALAFLAIALVAALFGFGDIASASAGIAQILFVIFLVLFIGTLIYRAVKS